MNNSSQIVFGINYLKKNILEYLNLYSILYVNIKFESREEWDEFKYKEYLNSVTLYFELDLGELPKNIKKLVYPKPADLNKVFTIPEHIESFKFRTFLTLSDLNSPLFALVISTGKLKSITYFDNVAPSSIPDCITSLSLYGPFKLPKNVLQKGLKKLKLFSIENFEEGCIPESLSSAVLTNSNLELINQLPSTLVDLTVTTTTPIDSALIKIPDSVENLFLQCTSYNSTSLPSKLKSLNLNVPNLAQDIEFPSTLESLSVFSQLKPDQELFKSRESVPTKLKSLSFPCSTFVDSKGQSILPEGLEKLIVTSSSPLNHQLKPNQLPSTLTHLSLSYEPHIFEDNVLPENLNTLIIQGNYTQVINPSAIPKQLKSLELYTNSYPHSLVLPPSTHPNTFVQHANLQSYYQPSNTDIRSLKLPFTFEETLDSLQLQDKTKLEHLHLGHCFNHPIQSSDLPSPNNIKTLELSNLFEDHIIDLEIFPNLETIILGRASTPIIKTTLNPNGTFNNYKLKSIISPKDSSNLFLKKLDTNFFEFLQIKQE